tara:strand:- start:819 stop:1355 length:537 start_codon:yes stop_codon:yes gene_type:complete
MSDGCRVSNIRLLENKFTGLNEGGLYQSRYYAQAVTLVPRWLGAGWAEFGHYEGEYASLNSQGLRWKSNEAEVMLAITELRAEMAYRRDDILQQYECFQYPDRPCAKCYGFNLGCDPCTTPTRCDIAAEYLREQRDRNPHEAQRWLVFMSPNAVRFWAMAPETVLYWLTPDALDLPAW